MLKIILFLQIVSLKEKNYLNIDKMKSFVFQEIVSMQNQNDQFLSVNIFQNICAKKIVPLLDHISVDS